MTLKKFQLEIPQHFGFLLILMVSISSIGQSSLSLENIKDFKNFYENSDKNFNKYNSAYKSMPKTSEYCNTLEISETNITTSDVFAKLNFQLDWSNNYTFWDDSFEQRYQEQFVNLERHPLKVFIVPHSHNDPGWLHTYLEYFEMNSKYILNSVISKMTEYSDLTFIWSEMSFLQLWWDQASLEQRQTLKDLIDSGRFEITTGGWVMTDEANVHVYAMIDQLIEGHQWIKTHLKTNPTFGWSVDPFGHGATIPFLLAASGFNGTIIQRIHYAWKHWFATHQSGDFIWQPFWKSSNKNNLLTHNMPFLLYTPQDSCGPFKHLCYKIHYDYINGEKSEIRKIAKLLIEQYSRTGSLFTHNVVLIPIGADFTYQYPEEIDEVYIKYKKLIDHINDNKNYFNAEISFGTPKDYFREIIKRTDQFPTLKGDFFVYADNPSPSYWSGYFSTRPFYKILSTELERNLRSSEILFTLAYNIARQNKYNNLVKLLETDYKNLILARRNLGLFQHHDAITGTSKAHVMVDYGMRLHESIKDTVKLKESTIGILLQKQRFEGNFLLNDLELNSFKEIHTKRIMSFTDSNVKSLVIFNSLAQKRIEILTIRSSTPHVSIINENGSPVKIQINPVYKIIHSEHTTKLNISSTEYEILFLAELPPISLMTFRIVPKREKRRNNLTTVYCKNCVLSNTRMQGLDIIKKQPVKLQLENSRMILFFNNKSGFLKSVLRKVDGMMNCAIMIAAYKSIQSGAYLFKTYRIQEDSEMNILNQYPNEIIIKSGPLCSDVTVVYGSFLTHTVRIFHTNTYLDNALYIENDVNYGEVSQHPDEELFMRFVTKINNGDNPEFYSDQNGFQFQHRVKVPSIGVEGNYFPITSAAFIQSETKRLTLLTAHPQGAASLRPGELEVILDRRTMSDDGRGMGEDVTDSILTRQKFWVIIEDVQLTNNYQMLSSLANYLGNSLRYTPNIYFVDDADGIMPRNLRTKISFLKNSFPCDLHLLNVRTLSDEQLPEIPSRSALVLLHRQGYDCKIGETLQFCNNTVFSLVDLLFNYIQIESIESTSLTGLNNFGPIENFGSMLIEPMDIKTFNLTFEFEGYNVK